MASTSTRLPSGEGRTQLLVETARQLGSTLEPAAIFARLRDSVGAAVPFDGIIVSPIRSAVAVLRLLRPTDSELTRWNDVIDLQVDHLARLIDDLLDVSRITRGALELRRRRVGLGDVVQGVVESTRDAMERLGQRLGVSLPAEPVMIDADPVRLAQVFGNLLDNATKFTPREGSVTLSARVAGNQVVVSIRDDGIGIGAETLPTCSTCSIRVARPRSGRWEDWASGSRSPSSSSRCTEERSRRGATDRGGAASSS